MDEGDLVESAECFWDSVIAGENVAEGTRKRPHIVAEAPPPQKKRKVDEALEAFLLDKPDFELREGSKGKMEVFVKSCRTTLTASLDAVKSFHDGKKYQKSASKYAAAKAKAGKKGTVCSPGGCAKCPYLARACANNHLECATAMFASVLPNDLPTFVTSSNDPIFMPIHNAAFTGNVDIVRLLVENGADVNSRASNGMTPLICAAKDNHPELCKWLVESGADKSLRTSAQYKKLHAGTSASDVCVGFPNAKHLRQFLTP